MGEISVESHVYYSIEIGGKAVPLITDAVVTMWVVTAVIIVAILLFTRNLSKIPKGPQKVMEMLVDFVNNLLKGQMEHHYKVFAPFICTVLLFLGLSNTISLFNIIPTGVTSSGHHFGIELEPPTRNINVTACLAIVTLIILIFSEFKFKGFKGWLRGFYKPNPIFGFVKILDYVVRPMSLCLRLFGNILGGVVAMTLIYGAIPILVPALVSVYFDIFDGILQAYVFVFLTVMYLAEAVELPEEVK